MSIKLPAAWIPVTAFVAALAGGYLGVSSGRARPAVTPERPDGSFDSAEIADALRQLRDEVRAARDQEPLREPERRPLEAEPGAEREDLDLLLDRLAALVEAGRSVADPPPVAAFRSAGATDVEAVQAACSGDYGETKQSLLYESYQELLRRFGRPDGVDEVGRWLWFAHWTGASGVDRGTALGGLRFTVSEGAVVRVEWLPPN